MMNLDSATAAINTAPVIPLEYNITLPLPCIGFKIIVPVIITTTFTVYFKQPFFYRKEKLPVQKAVRLPQP